jgi:hypothetical protein
LMWTFELFGFQVGQRFGAEPCPDDGFKLDAAQPKDTKPGAVADHARS